MTHIEPDGWWANPENLRRWQERRIAELGFKRGDTVIYIGPSWGAWHTDMIVEVSSLRLNGDKFDSVELWAKGTAIDNQRYPLDHVRPITEDDHVHCPYCCGPEADYHTMCFDILDNDCVSE